jgi:hypothetical protein
MEMALRGHGCEGLARSKPEGHRIFFVEVRIMADLPSREGTSSTGIRSPHTVKGRALKLAGSIALAAALALGGGGCTPPSSEKVLTDSEGNPIRLDQVFEIINDDELSEAEKRSQLQELGITDTALVDFFLQF